MKSPGESVSVPMGFRMSMPAGPRRSKSSCETMFLSGSSNSSFKFFAVSNPVRSGAIRSSRRSSTKPAPLASSSPIRGSEKPPISPPIRSPMSPRIASRPSTARKMLSKRLRLAGLNFEISATTPLTSITTAFAVGLGSGSSVRISRPPPLAPRKFRRFPVGVNAPDASEPPILMVPICVESVGKKTGSAPVIVPVAEGTTVLRPRSPALSKSVLNFTFPPVKRLGARLAPAVAAISILDVSVSVLAIESARGPTPTRKAMSSPPTATLASRPVVSNRKRCWPGELMSKFATSTPSVRRSSTAPSASRPAEPERSRNWSSPRAARGPLVPKSMFGMLRSRPSLNWAPSEKSILRVSVELSHDRSTTSSGTDDVFPRKLKISVKLLESMPIASLIFVSRIWRVPAGLLSASPIAARKSSAKPSRSFTL
jgi:hypothetical protein